MDATCITPFDVEGNAWNWDWPDPDDIPVGGLPDDHPLIQHQQALERAADEGDRQSAETDAYYARLYEEAKKHLPGDEYTTRLFSLSWSEIRDTRRTLEAVARATEIWAQRNDPDYGRQLSGRRCGTVSAYNAGCRCDACKRGKREAKRAQRARQMPVEEGAKRALERARRKPLPPRESITYMSLLEFGTLADMAKMPQVEEPIYEDLGWDEASGQMVRRLRFDPVYCARTARVVLTREKDGAVRVSAFRCGQPDCNICFPRWLEEVVGLTEAERHRGGALDVIADWDEVYCATVPREEWRTRKVWKEFRREWKGSLFGFYGDDGLVRVLAAGGLDEKPDNAGEFIVNAVLACPIKANRRKRVFGLKPTREASDEPYEFLARIPRALEAGASRVIEEALGRKLIEGTKHDRWGGGKIEAYVRFLVGCPPEEIRRVRDAVQAYLDAVATA